MPFNLDRACWQWFSPNRPIRSTSSSWQWKEVKNSNCSLQILDFSQALLNLPALPTPRHSRRQNSSCLNNQETSLFPMPICLMDSVRRSHQLDSMSTTRSLWSEWLIPSQSHKSLCVLIEPLKEWLLSGYRSKLIVFKLVRSSIVSSFQKARRMHCEMLLGVQLNVFTNLSLC